MIEIDETVTATRRRDAVFELLAQIERLPMWLPAIREARLVDPPPLSRGSRVALVVDGPTGWIDAAGEITDVESPRRLAFRTLDAPVGVTASCELTELDGDATAIRVRARIGLPGMLRFAEGMIRRRIEQERATALADLVARVEAAIPVSGG